MFFSGGFDMLAYIVVKFASLEYLDGQKLSDYLAKTYFDKEQAVPSSAAKEIMS